MLSNFIPGGFSLYTDNWWHFQQSPISTKVRHYKLHTESYWLLNFFMQLSIFNVSEELMPVPQSSVLILSLGCPQMTSPVPSADLWSVEEYSVSTEPCKLALINLSTFRVGEKDMKFRWTNFPPRQWLSTCCLISFSSQCLPTETL